MTTRQRTWATVAAVTAVLLLALGLVVRAAVTDLPPGTTLAGEEVGNPAGAEELATDLADRVASMPVVVTTGASSIETTAGGMGASFDVAGVRRAAAASTGIDRWIDRMTGAPPIALPAGLFFTTGAADEVAGELSTEPVDGAVEVTAGGVRVTDPVIGVSVTPTAVADAFREAAAALEATPLAEWPERLLVEVPGEEQRPTITQASVDAAVARIDELTATPVEVQASVVPEDAQTVDGEGLPTREVVGVELGAPALVQLLGVERAPDAVERERLRVVPSAESPPPALLAFLERAAVAPDLAVTVEDRSAPPSRVPADAAASGPGGPADQPQYGDVSAVSGDLVAEVRAPGLEPSLPETVQAIVTAMEAGETTAEVRGTEVREGDPADLGIVAPVSTWTTFYEPGQSRVTNIHRIAEILDGTMIPPGANLDINHAVGERTTAGGFTEGGAILDGEFVTDVGGGVSQFATTFFNAMWFSGVDIITHTPHSFWFDRYPAGREATIDYPGVDLELNNNTPHWILVDTAVTSDSVTVTFWSTPWFEVDTVMGARQPTAEGFRMRVERTATAPDGAVDDDSFTVDYKLP